MTAVYPFESTANDAPPVAYMVRVEMRDATMLDYAKLHEELALLGFLKLVVSDDGRVFHLPMAEYYGVSKLAIESLRDVVRATADWVRGGAQVLVTQANSMAWYLPPA